MATELPEVADQLIVAGVPMEVLDGALAEMVGAVPQVEPFQTWPLGQLQLEPFQTWPPVQMLTHDEPFQAVPAAQMLWQVCVTRLQAVPPGHDGIG